MTSSYPGQLLLNKQGKLSQNYSPHQICAPKFLQNQKQPNLSSCINLIDMVMSRYVIRVDGREKKI
jgi:hypothetical protein